MEHRLMVLGSMDAFIELVKLAQSKGIYVISCDGYEGGRAKAIADKAYYIDVRDTASIAQVCIDEGVDGIITDRPWILREVLEEKGAKLPPAREVDLPYHLATDHFEAEERKAEKGRDAAY